MKTYRTNRTAFSLVEIMVAMAISVAVLGAAGGFLVETSRGHIRVGQRVSQAMDIRKFTQEMIYNASRADQFYLYRSVANADWASPDNALVIDTSDENNPLHPAGDFIVFVYYEFPKPANQYYYRIKKLIGYYLQAPDGQTGAVRRVTIDLSKDLTNNIATPNDLVPDYNPAATTTRKTVVEQVLINNWNNPTHCTFNNSFLTAARGLLVSETDATGVGRMFYYRDPRSVLVAGQLFGDNRPEAINKPQTTTDTFTFAITPRS